MPLLAPIIPRPKTNLVIYSGVLAPNHRWRKRVVVYGREQSNTEDDGVEETEEPKKEPGRYIEWADLLKRTFDVDALQCPKCFGRMKLIAMIEQPEVIEKILDHLGLPTEKPCALPARSPPENEQLEIDYVDAEVYAE